MIKVYLCDLKNTSMPVTITTAFKDGHSKIYEIKVN